MTKVSPAITRLHKLKIVEEEILRFMRLWEQEYAAYEYTLQQFFTYIALEQEDERAKEEKATKKPWDEQERKPQTFLSEEEKTQMIQDYIAEPNKRGYRKILAVKYNVHEATVYNITKFIK